MSEALESLMRESVAEDVRPAPWVSLLSFLLIGGGAALCFVLLSAAAMALPIPVSRWIVSAVCYALFIVPVYLLHRRYSFASDAAHRLAFPRYLVVQLGGLGLASLFSYVAYGVIGLPTLAASMLVIGLTSGVNFMVLRAWAFRQPKV